MPIPLVEFPPTMRLLLWALVLAGMILAQFGVSLSATASDAGFLTEVQARQHCSPPTIARMWPLVYYFPHHQADRADR